GEGFYVHHTFQPVLAPDSYSVTIQEAGDSYFEIDITKNNTPVTRKELCNVDF
ncbi:MAG: hypothetical protein HRT44_13965, partial [Bdellovibrionales bacterium]|nr:hypothetical protein [Bdellovibrionales bacterium]